MRKNSIASVLMGSLILYSSGVVGQYNPFTDTRNSPGQESEVSRQDIDFLKFKMDGLESELREFRKNAVRLREELTEQKMLSSDAGSIPKSLLDGSDASSEDKKHVIPGHYESFMVVNGKFVLKNKTNRGVPYLFVDEATYRDRLMNITAPDSSAQDGKE